VPATQVPARVGEKRRSQENSGCMSRGERKERKKNNHLLLLDLIRGKKKAVQEREEKEGQLNVLQ